MLFLAIAQQLGWNIKALAQVSTLNLFFKSELAKHMHLLLEKLDDDLEPDILESDHLAPSKKTPGKNLIHKPVLGSLQWSHIQPSAKFEMVAQHVLDIVNHKQHWFVIFAFSALALYLLHDFLLGCWPTLPITLITGKVKN